MPIPLKIKTTYKHIILLLAIEKHRMESVTQTHFSDSTNNAGEPEQMTNDPFMARVEQEMTYTVGAYLAKYWFPTLVPIGLLGNTLSFLVMIKPSNRKLSTCNFMAAISINDNMMMFLALHNFLTTIVKIKPMNDFECKFAVYFTQIGLQNSTYQILAMTIDKYIAIRFPHKAAVYSTATRARGTAIGIFICVIIYNIPHPFSSGMVGDQCLAYIFGGNILKVYSWLSFFVNGIIPFTALIYMNYFIVKTVKGSNNMFKSNSKDSYDNKELSTGMQGRQKAMKSAENQLTIMLLLVTTLFLILLMPTYIRFIYSTLVPRDTPAKHASSILFFHITHKLYHTNNGINFFLYCLSGRKFRSDVREIVTCNGGQKEVKSRRDTETVSSVA